MKSIKPIIIALTLSIANAQDFAATPESVWQKHVGTPAPAVITESSLRTAIEWRVFGGLLPRLPSATPYGIRQKQWDTSIKNFGLPAVADEYTKFLRELRAELTREQQTKAQSN